MLVQPFPKQVEPEMVTGILIEILNDLHGSLFKLLLAFEKMPQLRAFVFPF